VLVLFFVFSSISNLSGADIYVDPDNGNDDGNGSIDSPKLTISNAVSSAIDNDTIHLKKGNYSGQNNTKIEINHSLSFVGEGKSDEIVINGKGANDFYTINQGTSVKFSNITFTNFIIDSDNNNLYNDEHFGILTVNGNISVFNCVFKNNTGNVFFISKNNSESRNTIVDSCYFYNNTGVLINFEMQFNPTNFTVKNSILANNSASPNTIGFGLINTYSGGLVENCSFIENRDNNDYNFGSYIISSRGNFTVSNSKFENNNLSLYLMDNPNVDNCSFIGEYSFYTLRLYGGVIKNSIFVNNTAKGSVIYLEQSNVYNLTFINNRGYNSGAIEIRGDYGSNYNTSIDSCVFINNSALSTTENSGGGAISITGMYTNSFTVKNSIFINNSASKGGAIYSYTYSEISYLMNFSLENCIFIGNNAKYGFGGAIYAFENKYNSINNCSFINNTAIKGGAIYTDKGEYLHIMSSVFDSNYASLNGSAIYSGTYDVNITYSLIFGGNVLPIYSSISDPIYLNTNWWGTNDGPSGMGNLVYDNYFVVDVVSNTPTVDNLNASFSYKFYLNDLSDFNLSLIHSFIVNVYSNGTNSSINANCNLTDLLNYGENNTYSNLVYSFDGKYNHSNISFPVFDRNQDVAFSFVFDKLNITIVLAVSYIPGTNISFNNITLDGKVINGSITLTDENGLILANKTIVFYLNSTEIFRTTTNDEGIAYFSYNSSDYGIYDIICFVEGNDEIISSYYKFIAVITDLFVEINNVTAYYNGFTYFKATVYDVNNNLISGILVYFYMNGEYIGQNITNQRGEAYLYGYAPFVGNFTYYAECRANEYPLTTSITKNGEFLKVNISNNYKISIVTSRNADNIVTLSVKVTNSKTGVAVPDKTVSFYLNNKLIKATKTNSNGIVTFTFSANSKATFNYKFVLNPSSIENTTHFIKENGLSSSGSLTTTVANIKKEYTLSKSVKKVKVSKKSKKTKKVTVYTLKYTFKNLGNLKGTKKFTIKISKKYKISDILKNKFVTIKYNKKKRILTVNVKNLRNYALSKESGIVIVKA